MAISLASNKGAQPTGSHVIYDALSRLRQANNPESGIVSYAYDDNSNLFTKTDARNVVTTFAYDGLNRVMAR
ncbi:MAG TPA: RHS repeat domain-containing protein [Blastocatellia bacterium]|nr:RHS repeat domain-containing protein [Blastocatellia bacterium]